jgi:hypothetical protein
VTGRLCMGLVYAVWVLVLITALVVTASAVAGF